MTEDEPTTKDNGESTRERVEAFVDSIEDVAGVTASVRGIGDACYAGVVVDHDYGNRDEYGDGVVGLSKESTDPVGREAYDRGMRVAKVVPQPMTDETRYAFATDDAFGESYAASTLASLFNNPGISGEIARLVQSCAEKEFGEDVVDYALELADDGRVEQ